MTRLTCMIVEDEPVSQEILQRFISDCPSLDLLKVCSNAIEAMDQLRTLDPDLLFLDITMPKLSGLDFYRSLSDPPMVIFTTAYPEYAVNGFEVNAVDYLVKPFSFERFLRAVNKAIDASGKNGSNPDFVMLMADKKMHKVLLNEILFAEAMGDYVKVCLPDKVLVVHMPLQKFFETLPARQFYRVHKSFVVSLTQLRYIEGNMVIIGKHQIPIGQTYRNDFLTLLQKK